MTRAKLTLALMNMGNQNPFIPLLNNHEAVVRRGTSQTLTTLRLRKR